MTWVEQAEHWHDVAEALSRIQVQEMENMSRTESKIFDLAKVIAQEKEKQAYMEDLFYKRMEDLFF